jgi:hypothetical protein
MTATTISVGLVVITAAILCWWLTRRPRVWCVLRGGYCDKHGQCPTSTDCWARRR